MRVAMINDCAFVGENIAKFLPFNFEVERILRTRSFWSKTISLLWKILCTKAEVYHVHYALQDAYLTLKLKREPVIVHVHGSDLRTTINSKWGFLVKYSVKNADKLLVTPQTF